MAAPTLTLASIADRYEALTLQFIHLETASFAAMSYLNLGEVAKAQNVLQGAILDAQIAQEARRGN